MSDAAIKVWKVEEIVDMLMRNNRAVEKAIVAIYNRQTQDEKVVRDTRWRNDVGFSGADAKRGTYYARWILSKRSLTGKHLERARTMAIRYRRQLCEIANSNNHTS